MKSSKKIVTVFILLTLILTFISCANDTDSKTLLFSPVAVKDPADKMEDTALIEMFETKLYENAKTVIRWYIYGSGFDSDLDLDMDSTFNNGNSANYVEVKDIKDMATLKAHYEAVFSSRILDKYIYPIFEGDTPTFVEHNGKLYFNTGVAGGFIDAPDFTLAKVINKSTDTFEIEMPMDDPDIGVAVFTYKAIQQNGNWVLDRYFYYTASFND
ncbi:MAG: hypothetical protein FWF15_08725 [Oscillospiraceae bacterium]|nr:hypothetical protein [Oscillospiraceae bacterium]